jgi:Phosphotransferase enzyme family
MTPEGSAGFADACARVCPGFSAVATSQRGRKSELLAGVVDGLPVIAKRVRRPSPIWDWYAEREVALYRAFQRDPLPVVAPRLVAAAQGILIIERLAGEPMATRRHPEAQLSDETVRAFLELRARLAAWCGLLPDAPPAPRVRSRMRERLLEDPTAPVVWIREGVETCRRRGLLDEDLARRVDDAIAAHAPVAFGHGDLLLRNALWQGAQIALVDWECAGSHIHDWDLALLWSQLVPPARLPIEDAVRGDRARWRAFLALTVFALARELKFLRSFTAHPRGTHLARLQGELAEAAARFTQATRS